MNYCICGHAELDHGEHLGICMVGVCQCDGFLSNEKWL